MKEKRSKGQRRWGISAVFPLVDEFGVTVISDRRRIPDRRLPNTSFEDRLIGFAEMPPSDLGQKKEH